MHYWPTTARPSSKKITYLVATNEGIGSFTVPEHAAAAALQQLRQGLYVEGLALIPMHLLMRVQSYQDSTSLIVRQHAGKSQRFQLRTVAARNEAMRVLRDHPAVKESNMLDQPLADRITPRLAACAVLSILGWIAFELFVANGRDSEGMNQLSLGVFTELPFVLLPISIGVIAVGAAVYTLWQSRQETPTLEEVLFK
ncbi:hypothetical protein GGR28_003011 [Lewinella aquimaris]|uniref:Uncharacterized protein n=1 Tax=Neolewinella aquimaris TaxID=1835722 RepID=A0A840EAE0_9BACT|nr:hypothetical protein [Neolewinella aquimaris]MBB4080377.1 hypothetical protein [Neolewinella aquimaris]